MLVIIWLLIHSLLRFLKHWQIRVYFYFVKVYSIFNVGFMPVSSSKEQVVSSVSDYSLLQVGFWDLSHVAVIILVPFFVQRVLSEGCVMAEAHVTEMVWDGVAIIDQWPVIWLISANDVFTHVQAFEREVHLIIYFLTATTTRVHGKETCVSLLFLPKSFKAYNHDWWDFIDLNLFGGLYVIFTFVAIPHIVSIQDFWLLEFLKAVVNGNFHFLGLISRIVCLDSIHFSLHRR